jgi:AraC-like DNA-binding protein
VAYVHESDQGEAAFAVWHEACRPVLEVSPREPASEFRTRFEFYDVGGLIFNCAQYSAATYRRTSRHLRRTDDDAFVLHLLLRGKEVGVAGRKGGQAFRMGPDRIVLHDWGHAYVSSADATEQISVAVPRHFIERHDVLYRGDPVISWSLSSAPGRLLASALIGVWRGLPTLTTQGAPSVAAGFLGLLNGLLGQPGSLPSDHASCAMMKTWLRRNLGNPGLGPADLVKQFPHSRASIYRLFAKVGGVQAFIREERLSACYWQLAHGALKVRSIADLAHSYGYTDPGHFHRAFKRRFGMTPGDVAKLNVGPTEEIVPSARVNTRLQGDMSDLHRWLSAGD